MRAALDADFLAWSYGAPPTISLLTPRRPHSVAFPKGFVWAVEFDIADLFGSIDHDMVMGLVARRVSHRRVLKLIRAWRRGGDGRRRVQETAGAPGGPIGPILATIVLHERDVPWAASAGRSSGLRATALSGVARAQVEQALIL